MFYHGTDKDIGDGSLMVLQCKIDGFFLESGADDNSIGRKLENFFERFATRKDIVLVIGLYQAINIDVFIFPKIRKSIILQKVGIFRQIFKLSFPRFPSGFSHRMCPLYIVAISGNE